VAWAELDELDVGVEDDGARVVEVVALEDVELWPVAAVELVVRPEEEDDVDVAVDLAAGEVATAVVVW
jgi:hypothetical protein